MNWAARSAWVYQESIPDTAKAARYGIETVYVDPRSSNAAAAIKELRAAGIEAGAYVSSAWPEVGGGAVQGADWFSSKLDALLPRVGTAEAPPAMLDLETGSDIAWAVSFITRYRAHQPHRPTAYTNAPFQGGYVPVSTLRLAAMPFFVQLYYGDMRACAAEALLEAALDYEPAQVYPFYDGAALPSDSHEGCIFTLERLP